MELNVNGINIVDIHSHILFGIDDGSFDLEESLYLIQLGYNQGIKRIFCTNHSYGMQNRYENYYNNFLLLNREIVNRYSDLSIYYGCEILCSKDNMNHIVTNIKQKIYPTMNKTKYVLIEFDPNTTDGINEILYCVRYLINNGLSPIIAHVERYLNIYDNPLRDLYYLKRVGCLTQINLFSVKQDVNSRKKLANLFLQNHLIDFVGTDTHRMDYKSTEAIIGSKSIISQYGDEYGHLVLDGNAKKLLTI